MNEEKEKTENRVLGEKYILGEVLGRGGSGIVYKAYDKHLKCYRAVKKFTKEDGVSVKELELLKELNHPAFPAVTDYLEEEDGSYLVMEYVDGKNLAEYLEEKGGMDEEKAVKQAVELAEVLIYLHERENPIIYGDMKPANIMIDSKGRLRLVDFGTARLRYKREERDSGIAGTYGYAPPEQTDLIEGHKPDEKWDVYSLGATLFHILTGCNPSKPPYRMEPIRFYRGSLSGKLEKIVKKATGQKAEERYQTARQLKNALENYRRTKWIRSCIAKEGRMIYGLLLLGVVISFMAACVRLGVLRDWLVYADVLKQRAVLDRLMPYGIILGMLLLGRRLFYLVKRRGSNHCRLVRNSMLTEKKGRGLLLFLLVFTVGTVAKDIRLIVMAAGTERTVQTECENPLRVHVRNSKGQKILIRYDAEYSPEGDLKLEVPISNFKAGERYELRLECKNRETKEVSSRTFYLKGLEP